MPESIDKLPPSAAAYMAKRAEALRAEANKPGEYSIENLLALANNQALELFNVSVRGGLPLNVEEKKFLLRMTNDCTADREISLPDLRKLDDMWYRYIGRAKFGPSNSR